MSTKIEPIGDLGPKWSEKPADVTSRLERTLVEQRRMAQDIAPIDFWSKSTSERNIAALEAAIERSRRNDAARSEREAREAAQKAEEQKASEQRRQQAEDEMKARLRNEFMVGNPIATEADFERLWPQMRDQHLSQQANAVMEETRRRYRALI